LIAAGKHAAHHIADCGVACDFLAMPDILPYASASLDRAAHRRIDDAWIAAVRADQQSWFVAYWRGKLLIDATAPAAPRAVLAAHPVANDIPWVFLGIFAGQAAFAVDLSAHEAPLEHLTSARGAMLELRGLAGALPEGEAALLATARALLYWQSRHQFCGVCGGACLPERAGHTMRCTVCATEHFPRTDPAVIMLVEQPNRVLLGQSHKFPIERNFFSTLAGFVEPGESLEDAVRREVLEEVGIQIGAVRYIASQPWPFPASLMLGFRASALTDAITLDEDEMRAARWFTRAEIDNRKASGFNLPPHDSIARRLIDAWMSENNDR
jgi:NAD+ diphosphatase